MVTFIILEIYLQIQDLATYQGGAGGEGEGGRYEGGEGSKVKKHLFYC